MIGARAERFALQSVARALLPDFPRVGFCLRRRRSGGGSVEVLYSPVRQCAHLGGLMTCGRVWLCPVCSCRIGEERRAELEAGVSAWRGRGGAVLFRSLTVAHPGGRSLDALLPALLEAARWMESHRDYKALRRRCGVAGTVKGLEDTWGPTDGHHPHLHGLTFCEVSTGLLDVAAFEEELYRLWSAALARFGLRCSRSRGVVVQATDGAIGDYLAKFGRLPARGRAWGPVDELVKSTSKRGRAQLAGDGDEHLAPFELLRRVLESGALWTGEGRYVLPFRAYARAFTGRRQLTWTPGLRALLGLGVERSDEEIADEGTSPGDVSLALLDALAWAAVLRFDQRAPLLALADAGEAGPVLAFVADLVARYWAERSL